MAAERSGDPAQAEAKRTAFTATDNEVKKLRAEAVGIVREVSGDRSYNDVNYVFPTFVTTHLPRGIVGLVVAAILVAAMSASSAELTALSTSSVIDFYRRFGPANADDRHVLMASRVATGFWGLFASIVAVWASELGSLIEVVNRFGSLFYGSILGVFILAVGFKRANSTGAFAGILAGMTTVLLLATYTKLAFLWHNPVAAFVVVSVGVVVSALTGGNTTKARAAAAEQEPDARPHDAADHPRDDPAHGRVVDPGRIPASAKRSATKLTKTTKTLLIKVLRVLRALRG